MLGEPPPTPLPVGHKCISLRSQKKLCVCVFKWRPRNKRGQDRAGCQSTTQALKTLFGKTWFVGPFWGANSWTICFMCNSSLCAVYSLANDRTEKKRMIVQSPIHKIFLCWMWWCWFDVCFCVVSKIGVCSSFKRVAVEFLDTSTAIEPSEVQTSFHSVVQ